jgi:hypothetical protein
LKERKLEVAIIEVEYDVLDCEKRPNELLNDINVFVFVMALIVEREVNTVPANVLIEPVVPPICKEACGVDVLIPIEDGETVRLLILIPLPI